MDGNYQQLLAVSYREGKGSRWLWHCVSYLCLIPPLSAVEYSGSGIIEYRVFSPTNSSQIVCDFHYQFKFGVSNDFWQIHTERKGGNHDFFLDEALYDGTNTYLTTQINDLANLAASFDPKKSITIVGQIFPTEFPPPSIVPINPIWLAYCSGTRLRKSGHKRFPPLWQGEYDSVFALDYKVPTSLSFLDTDLFLPRECVQYSDGCGHFVAFTNGTPYIVLDPWFTGVFAKGFTRVRYTVSETTNIAGCIFPKQFKFMDLRPQPNGQSSNDVQVLAEYDAKISTIKFGRSDIHLETGVAQFASIVDYRPLALKPRRDRIQYTNPTNHWLPMAPGSLAYELYENELRAYKPMPRWLPTPVVLLGYQFYEAAVKRPIIFCVLLALSFVAIAFFFFGRRSNDH